MIKDFPIFKRKVNGKRLVYLDSTATTQKPMQVIGAIKNFYENSNANVHRGIHRLSEEATEQYESSRNKIAGFINSKNNEVIFTRNATESINLVSNSLEFKKDDEIITTYTEHHSNLVPWQETGAKLRFLEIDKVGNLIINEKLFTKKTKLVAVTGCSNVIGTINDINKITKIAHENGAMVLVDGAQLVPHKKVDVKRLDIDFLAFSGHKMLGPTGIGVLYGKEKILERMKPFMKGGDMIKEVTRESATWNDLPYKFEAGTPNIAGAIGFGAAIDYLQNIGMETIENHEKEIIKYAMKRAEQENLKVYGKVFPKAGILSFNIKDIHPHDVATILDQQGIAIRSGHLCAQPLMHHLGINSACRASFYIYNNEKDVDALFTGLKVVRQVFK